MISSVFPLVDIFCMQTSWATHVINIMALNNCDQNSCDVGLHNPEHFLYVSYAPNNDNKNIEIIENISVHDSRYSTLQTVPAVRVSVVSSSQWSVIIGDVSPIFRYKVVTCYTPCLTLHTSQLNSRSSQEAASLFLFSLPLITCMHLHLLVVY